MDLIENPPKRAKITIISQSLNDIYPHTLHMYGIPPGCNISLPEFEELALERLQVLKILEHASLKGHEILSSEWKECIYTDLLKFNLNKFHRLAKCTGTDSPTEGDLQARRADHISHFILRLAFCYSEELRNWFLKREEEWFLLKFSQLTLNSVKELLEINGLIYEPISNEEKSEIHQELYESTSGVHNVITTDFYKVNWCEVTSLIRNKGVYINKAFAYVPEQELIICISGVFTKSLNKALVHASNHFPQMDDDHINFLVSKLQHVNIGKDFLTETLGPKINLEDIDAYSKHFPLCMKHMYNILKQEHSLKYICRLHFGLFIKGIGVSFEDAMIFFRREFTKKIDNNTFNQRYGYWVKHMYGKVGSRIDYNPYTCHQIINESVGPGDQHGCPYKHWDRSVLKAKLKEMGMDEECVANVLGPAAKGEYQTACSKCFEYTHNESYKTIINHPTEYFQESLDQEKNNSLNEASAVFDVDWDEPMEI